MTISTDRELIRWGSSQRSIALAHIYTENAEQTPCRCADVHDDNSQICQRAIWNHAATIARMMVED